MDDGGEGRWFFFFEMEMKGGTHLGVFETFVKGDEEVGVRGPQSEVCVRVCGDAASGGLVL